MTNMPKEFWEAASISKSAKELGYSTAVQKGKLQFQIVKYRANGTSEVTPVTDWLTFEEAKEILCASK